MTDPPGRLAPACTGFAAAVATTLAAAAVAGRASPGATARWARVNHRGEPVTLLEGPAVAAGAALALALPLSTPRARAAGAVAVLGAGALGAYDDLAGDSGSKGLRGHLGALRHGQVTTGAAKVVGLGLVGLVAAAIGDAGRRPAIDGPAIDGLAIDGRAIDVLAGGAVVAGCANLVNLLDLR
ncbi:MAG TPA: hypothetical protein VF661_16035, partial [Actinomycetales bacterium]